jgi:mannose-6-phosphate isomerase-like protein (cupin superfamily)
MLTRTNSSWYGRAAFASSSAIELGPGDCIVVPRGVEHRTCADAEAHVVCFEPAGVVNTGDVVDATYTAPTGVAI